MQNEVALTGTPAVEDQHDAELVARAKEKSSGAWDEIYTRHYPLIYRYVHARVFDADVAADLTASVFLGAVKGIRSYHYQGQPFLAWLYRIARNVISSHQRTMFRQRTLSLNAVIELPGRVFGQKRQGGEPASGPEADPGTTVERMDLRQALAGLPAAQRDVLVLKFFAGMDAKEIADVVEKEPAAVYSLQARGLQALRRRLS